MNDASHRHESGEHLIAMANDIGDYFRSQERPEAIAGIANHIRKYWTPRMLQKLNAYLSQGHGGLDDLPRAALEQLHTAAKAT